MRSFVLYQITALILAFVFVAVPGRAPAQISTEFEAAWKCVELNTPERSILTRDEYHSPRTIALENGFIYVHGLLGWHETWALLFDTTSDQLIAFETYDRRGKIRGAFGRRPVPLMLRWALRHCGVEWGGLWQRNFPKRAAPLQPNDKKSP